MQKETVEPESVVLAADPKQPPLSYPTIAEIEELAHQMDPLLPRESVHFQALVLVLAAFYMRPFTLKELADFTGYAMAFVTAFSKNMRAGGLWRRVGPGRFSWCHKLAFSGGDISLVMWGQVGVGSVERRVDPKDPANDDLAYYHTKYEPPLRYTSRSEVANKKAGQAKWRANRPKKGSYSLGEAGIEPSQSPGYNSADQEQQETQDASSRCSSSRATNVV